MIEVASMINTVSLTGNRARVRRYRTLHRRIDYVPSHDVLPIIQYYLKIGTDPCLAGVIDYLIRSGHQAITGNGGK
jgi:hypothetical protein